MSVILDIGCGKMFVSVRESLVGDDGLLWLRMTMIGVCEFRCENDRFSLKKIRVTG